MARRARDLGEAELEILRILWDRGACTVREVLEALHGSGRKVAYTTVLTTLSRLEQKKFVASNKSGMAYVYRARISRDRVVRSRIGSLVQQLFDGAPGSLVVQLMESERFTPEELAQFRALIDRLDEDRGPGGRR
ncbi:MAG: BlaI/MecI/CopY family transcriptional regulator [Phycisphaerales bacterium JB039]